MYLSALYARDTIGVLFASGIVTVVLIVDEKLAKTHCPAFMSVGRLRLHLCVKQPSVWSSLAQMWPKWSHFRPFWSQNLIVSVPEILGFVPCIVAIAYFSLNWRVVMITTVITKLFRNPSETP